jgi:hypothetical protein
MLPLLQVLLVLVLWRLLLLLACTGVWSVTQ